MKDLFEYLKKYNDLILIKSCVFHYEFEFIHPFLDGNGRMGRFWQTLILIQQYPVFEFLPVESLIKQKQSDYYNKLSESDKKGNSTPFIEFMLEIILESLDGLLQSQSVTLHTEDRIRLFAAKISKNKFSRKEYMQHFKNISAPTASRDLKCAVEQNLLAKLGALRLTEYQFK
jgi:Fic family protein